MPDEPQLQHPWLVAVWPGMGHVALTAGYYLMAKLGMRQLAEFSAAELFDADHVDVKNGLIRPGRLPRSRLFVWSHPQGVHDIVLFIGEAQPPRGSYAFCRRLVEHAAELGVERVFTFAALATAMRPGAEATVYGAATDVEGVDELRRLELSILEDGHIGGLNGVLAGVAAESGLRGTCLLGEMPHLFAQLPFPRSSLAVLEAFATIASIEIDLAELAAQAEATERTLGELLARMEGAMAEGGAAEEETFRPEPPEEVRLSDDEEERIEKLFEQAAEDRSKAYELKNELDRLNVFKLYEDRFLDLFRES